MYGKKKKVEGEFSVKKLIINMYIGEREKAESERLKDLFKSLREVC